MFLTVQSWQNLSRRAQMPAPQTVGASPPLLPIGNSIRQPKMKTTSESGTRGHRRVFAVAAMAAALFAASAVPSSAGTLLWYRFDGDGAKIENKAKPGTMDGTLKSMNTWGSVGSLSSDTDTSKFPVRGDAFPAGTKLFDPASAAVHGDAVKSLSFTGNQSTAGVILLTKPNAAPLVNLTSFTCEFFFKIPAAAASRSPALFPLVTWGEDQNQGWKLGFFRSSGTKLSPWFRGVKKTSAGEKGAVVTINAANGNKDNYAYDTWHHLALVVDGAGDGTSATAKLVLDYTNVFTLTISDYYGFYFKSESGFPFIVGADIYRNHNTATSRETFMGDIAEFRISDTALSNDELLRPLPAGPMDADTLLYLPMGDSGWFGSQSSASYENKWHGILPASTNAAWTPFWVHGSTSAAYPAVAADAASDSVRSGYLASESFADTSSVLFSRTLASGAYQGHAVKIPYEEMGLAEDSFTVEWFFKTDGQVPSGNIVNSYTFMYPSFAKIMINQADGKLKTRLIPHEGNYSDYDSASRVDDARWHHYALVYDKAQGAFSIYLDYARVSSTTLAPATGTSREFLFGGETAASQVFAGDLDDFRITKRALRPHEFLTSRAVVSTDAALLAHFDGDYSTSQDAVLAPSGSGAAISGGTAPTFVAQERSYDADGDGRADFTSSQALSLAGGSVSFPRNSMLEYRDFTVEWFAKYDHVANGAMLLRFEMSPAAISWALYYPSHSGSGNDVRLGANVSTTGGWSSLHREDIDIASSVDIADGRWHHWALVAETDTDATPASTTFTLYRNYERFGVPAVFDGANGAGGILALPTTGTTLSFGTGAAITGLIDELRFTPAVLPASAFLRRLANPFVLVVR